jgi:hypothetical protein
MDDELGSITIDITGLGHIDDAIRILKAILLWWGFAMRTIDDVFEDKELNG